MCHHRKQPLSLKQPQTTLFTAITYHIQKRAILTTILQKLIQSFDNPTSHTSPNALERGGDRCLCEFGDLGWKIGVGIFVFVGGVVVAAVFFVHCVVVVEGEREGRAMSADGRYCCCLAYYRVLFACFKSITLKYSILLAESQCKPSYLFGYTYYTGTIPSQPPTFHHDVPTIVEHHHLLGIYPTTSTMYARIHITSKYSNTPSIHPSTRHSTTDPTSHH